MAPPAFLRSAPREDPRPDPLAAEVLLRATNARLDEIKAWLSPRLPALSEEEIKFALMTGMKRGGADGYRASRAIQDEFGWPVDIELCQFVRDTCNALAFALRTETRAWVVRVGLRFPGKDGDKIEWLDEGGKACAGQIIAVDRNLACAIVQPSDGLYKAGKPRRVHAEQVTANTTKGEYAVYSIGPSDIANEAG